MSLQSKVEEIPTAVSVSRALRCRLQADGKDGRGDVLGGGQVSESAGRKALRLQEDEA